MPRRPVAPEAPRKETELARGKRLENDHAEEHIRTTRIQNDAAELAHKREASRRGTEHHWAREDAKTRQAEASAALAEHNVSHAQKMGQTAHAAAQSSLIHQKAMNAHERSRARGDASWEDEKRQRQRVEWQHADEDRAHRLVHEAQLHHAIRAEHRRQVWTAIAHGLTGEGGGVKGAMRKQVGGGH